MTTGNGVHFGAGGSHAKKSWGIIATDTMHSMLTTTSFNTSSCANGSASNPRRR